MSPDVNFDAMVQVREQSDTPEKSEILLSCSGDHHWICTCKKAELDALKAQLEQNKIHFANLALVQAEFAATLPVNGTQRMKTTRRCTSAPSGCAWH